jgi:hypothetical protein
MKSHHLRAAPLLLGALLLVLLPGASPWAARPPPPAPGPADPPGRQAVLVISSVPLDDTGFKEAISTALLEGSSRPVEIYEEYPGLDLFSGEPFEERGRPARAHDPWGRVQPPGARRCDLRHLRQRAAHQRHRRLRAGQRHGRPGRPGRPGGRPEAGQPPDGGHLPEGDGEAGQGRRRRPLPDRPQAGSGGEGGGGPAARAHHPQGQDRRRGPRVAQRRPLPPRAEAPPGPPSRPPSPSRWPPAAEAPAAAPRPHRPCSSATPTPPSAPSSWSGTARSAPPRTWCSTWWGATPRR